MSLGILYQDEALLVIEKPPGVACESAGGGQDILALVEAETGLRCHLIHRLDRETGGVLLLARDPRAAARFSALVAARAMEKRYLAVAEGVPDPPQGACADLLYHDPRRNKSYVVTRPRRGVKEARLHYALLERVDGPSGPLSLLRVELETGRTHQIRVQLAHRGLPLYGDSRYGSAHRGEAMALWCYSVALTHPDTGAAMVFRSPPPSAPPWSLFRPVDGA